MSWLPVRLILTARLMLTFANLLELNFGKGSAHRTQHEARREKHEHASHERGPMRTWTPSDQRVEPSLA